MATTNLKPTAANNNNGKPSRGLLESFKNFLGIKAAGDRSLENQNQKEKAKTAEAAAAAGHYLKAQPIAWLNRATDVLAVLFLALTVSHTQHVLSKFEEPGTGDWLSWALAIGLDLGSAFASYLVAESRITAWSRWIAGVLMFGLLVAGYGMNVTYYLSRNAEVWAWALALIFPGSLALIGLMKPGLVDVEALAEALHRLARLEQAQQQQPPGGAGKESNATTTNDGNNNPTADTVAEMLKAALAEMRTDFARQVEEMRNSLRADYFALLKPTEAGTTKPERPNPETSDETDFRREERVKGENPTPPPARYENHTEGEGEGTQGKTAGAKSETQGWAAGWGEGAAASSKGRNLYSVVGRPSQTQPGQPAQGWNEAAEAGAGASVGGNTKAKVALVDKLQAVNWAGLNREEKYRLIAEAREGETRLTWDELAKVSDISDRTLQKIYNQGQTPALVV